LARAVGLSERHGQPDADALINPKRLPSTHPLRALPGVVDVRNYGLVAGIEYEPIAGKPGARGFDTFVRAFEAGILIRVTGDIIALSPPLIIEKKQVDQIVETLRGVLSTLD